MLALIAFLWNNWAWLSTLASVVAALFVFRFAVGSWRWFSYGLAGLAFVLALFTIYDAAQDWRTAIRAQRDTEWQIELARQRSEEQSRQLTAAADDYQRGLAKGAELAAAAIGDKVATRTEIERIIHDSPTADSCRYDPAAASGSNRLRERPD